MLAGGNDVADLIHNGAAENAYSAYLPHLYAGAVFLIQAQ